MAMEIMARVRPEHRIDKVWNIWPDVVFFRDNNLTYKQVAGILRENYGVDVTAPQLIVICCHLRKRAKKQAPASMEAKNLVAAGVEASGNSVAILGQVKARLADRNKEIFKRKGDVNE